MAEDEDEDKDSNSDRAPCTLLTFCSAFVKKRCTDFKVPGGCVFKLIVPLDSEK